MQVERTTNQEFQPGFKRAVVKFPGGTRQPQEVFIAPGTTVSELLNKLGIPGNDFLLSKGSPDTIFNMNEVLYPHLADGDLLFLTSRVEAGR